MSKDQKNTNENILLETRLLFNEDIDKRVRDLKDFSVSTLLTDIEVKYDLLRQLHILKGGFAFFGLIEFSDATKHTEELVKKNSDVTAVQKSLDKLIFSIEAYLKNEKANH